METAREFYYKKINPDKMANQIIHETIINLMEEYAQEVAKNLHKPLIMRWRVVSGIFEGHEFDGHRVVINNEARIWDCGTAGRSHLETDCVQVANSLPLITMNEVAVCDLCKKEFNRERASNIFCGECWKII